jgi:hypothetical protein
MPRTDQHQTKAIPALLCSPSPHLFKKKNEAFFASQEPDSSY